MIYVALGSNREGKWGQPADIVAQAVQWIGAAPSCRLLRQSPRYLTAGIGPGQPAPFVNAVIGLESHLPPQALLGFLKQMERAAGPRSSLPWGPRSLDLDIVDYHGMVRGWHGRQPPIGNYRQRGQLVLPHPLAHTRPFVLKPLTDIAPQWRHPVFRFSALQLFRCLAGRNPGRVLEKLP